MAQKKLIRFEAIKKFKNVIEYPNQLDINWQTFFNNQAPIFLELACGKGEYTVSIARMNPNINMIGIDIKGNRLWNGAKTALVEDLQNVAFIRTQIQFIDQYFSANSIDEIWITFPDPHLKRKAKNRLTHPNYLNLYKKILKPNGIIHLKTDSPILYEFTLEVISNFQHTIIHQSNNLYQEPFLNDILQIKTHYEKLDIAATNKIYYVCFRFSF